VSENGSGAISGHRDRVALVGDACDCPTFDLRAGSVAGYGGAYILAEPLHETASYQEAFQR
jgi:2-polyprenyl-6-methoxyphenol hydroxylase-like FAD-dependent oxidoreductase